MIDVEQILKTNAEMKSGRAQVEAQYRDIAKLMRPEQSDMFDGNSRTNVYDDIYDGTAISALETFSGGLFSNLINPASRWFTPGLPDENDDLKEFQPVKQWFWDVGNIMLGSLAPGMSNFYVEAAPLFSDLGAFGIGTMYQEEAVGSGRIIDRAIALGETLFDLGPDNDIDSFHRNFKLKGAKAKVKFPELAGANWRIQDASEYEFVHAVFANPSQREGALGPAGMPFLSVYCSRQIKGFSRLGGYREMPYATVLWNRRPGRVWPVGPGHTALPDVRMLNAMERTHIVAAEFAADPTLLFADEGTVTPADIYPGAALYGQVNERGQPLAQPLSRGSDLRLSMEQSAQRRDAVREAFFFNMMQQLMRRPQMTATEFLGFQEEFLRLMGPNLARIQSQFLSPFLMRRFGILARAGAFPPLPQELEGRPLAMKIISPLAKLQQAADARAVTVYVNGVAQLAAATGDSAVLDDIDGDGAAAILHEASGAPPSARRDPLQKEEIRKQRAAIAAQQQQIANDAQQTETAAVAAHAVQAQTLASQRGARP